MTDEHVFYGLDLAGQSPRLVRFKPKCDCFLEEIAYSIFEDPGKILTYALDVTLARIEPRR